MTTHFAKPENALKRAEEYVAAGDKNTALQTLHAVLSSKRHHAKDKAAQKVFERIMFKYLDLCIEMRKGKMAKDGLHQYKYVMKTSKGVAQAQNAPSLEVVIRHFLAGAENAAMEAQSKSDEIVGEIEDLDEAPSAETLLLSVVSGEGARGRTDRQVVTPWLKFLWETYRTVLEILRNNPKLEHLYAYTAQQAFKFCQQYNRKTEFRRLADILRIHLQGLNKQQGQVQGVTLSNPDTAQLLLEIRFAQLNVATQMELWQESFRSVEDVHNLMLQSKKSTPPEMMCLYFERLTQIFWQAKNYLFHAYSCIKYFNLLRKLKPELTEDQVRALASQVLLATLSIPLGGSDDEADNGLDFNVQREKNLRLANLLGFTAPVPRNQLLAGLLAKDILGLAYPELKGLYDLLEHHVNPLKFGVQVLTHLEFIRGRPELCVYAEPIIANSFRRVMQHIVPMFHTIRITHLQKLVGFMPAQDLERLLVDSVAERLFEARIDHRSGIISFSSERIDAPELKGQLSTLSERFERALHMIDPAIRNEKLNRKKKHLHNIMRTTEEEHHSILIRKAFIEKRKEAEEERNRRKQKEREDKARQEWEAAQRAAVAEAEEKQRVQEQLAEKMRKAKLEQLKKEIDDSDPQEHFRQQVQKLREEKEDMEKRMKKLAKRLNHLERARREEERPLLEKLFAEKLDEDKKYHQEQIEKFLQEHFQLHQMKVQEKKRLLQILPHRGEFEAVVEERRLGEYNVRKAQQEKRKAQLREELERAKERQSKMMARRETIEEQKREIEEELRRKRQEEEAKRRAEQEEKERVERERVEKLEKQAEHQRQREREILERRKREEEERKSAAADYQGGWKAKAAAASAADVGKWRREEEQQSELGRRPAGPTPTSASDSNTSSWRDRRTEAAPRRVGGESIQPRREEGNWKAREDSGPQDAGAWKGRSAGGDGGFRSQEPRREEGAWKSDGPRRDEGAWKNDGPRRDEGAWKNDGPRRDEGAWKNDGPRRDEGSWRSRQSSEPRRDEGAWKGRNAGGEGGGFRSQERGGDGGFRGEGGFRSQEPRREEGSWKSDGPRREEGSWKRQGSQPRTDDGGAWGRRGGDAGGRDTGNWRDKQ